MALQIVSRHVPDRDGTAAGRALLALRDGLLVTGTVVQVHSWGGSEPAWLPAGCTWEPHPVEPALRGRARAVVRPRSVSGLLRWRPEDDTTVIADDPVSFDALPHGRGRSRTVTVHHLFALDRAATGSWRPRDVQDIRAERRVIRRAESVLAYSKRVADATGVLTEEVPIALHVPPTRSAHTEPIVGLLADWRWAPNRVALDRLLAVWPAVRRAVPAARLSLGGRGSTGVGSVPGVTDHGEVADSAAFRAELAVLGFPCPSSSGPKVKVLEAVMEGLTVVTTTAGLEGTAHGGHLAPADDAAGFARALIGALTDPQRAATLSAAAQVAARRRHEPVAAARARLAAMGV